MYHIEESMTQGVALSFGPYALCLPSNAIYLCLFFSLGLAFVVEIRLRVVFALLSAMKNLFNSSANYQTSAALQY